MPGEAVLGVFLVQHIHDSIASNLGQDAGGGDTEADPVTPDQRGMLDRQSLNGQAIHKGMGALMSVFMKSYYGTGHGKMSCPQDIELSDFL